MAQYKGAASEAGRAMQLMKKREKEREQLEQLKQKIAEVCQRFTRKISRLGLFWAVSVWSSNPTPRTTPATATAGAVKFASGWECDGGASS